MEQTLSLIEKTAFLKSLPVLSSIPTEPLAEVAARAQEMTFDHGEPIFNEGDPDRGTFVVVEGLLQLRRGDAVVRVLGPGMAFGELWLREGDTHHYALIAVEHTHVLNVTGEDVIEAMLEYPEFGVAMVRAFGERIHELTNRILDLETTIRVLYAELKSHSIEPPDLPPSALDPSVDELDLFGVTRGTRPSLTTPEPGNATDGRST